MNKKMNNRGFTLIELMIVVAIIGILAAVAIPNFLRYQLRARSGEAPVNVSALRTVQVSYYASNDNYVPAAAAPRAYGTLATSGNQRQEWSGALTTTAEWQRIGWIPEGSVYFIYNVDTTAAFPNAQNFTVSAIADLDTDTSNQCWLYVQPLVVRDPSGAVTAQTPADPSGPCVLDPSQVSGSGSNASSTYRFREVYKASLDGNY